MKSTYTPNEKLQYWKKRLAQNPLGVAVLCQNGEGTSFGSPGRMYEAVAVTYFSDLSGKTLELLPSGNFPGNFEFWWTADGDILLDIDTADFCFQKFFRKDERIPPFLFLTKIFFGDTVALIYLESVSGSPIMVKLREPCVQNHNTEIDNLFTVLLHNFEKELPHEKRQS